MRSRMDGEELVFATDTVNLGYRFPGATILAIEANYDKDILARCERLPEKTREVVYLRLSGELPFSEIGAILGESETWARVTFYRAKQKLLEGGGV